MGLNPDIFQKVRFGVEVRQFVVEEEVWFFLTIQFDYGIKPRYFFISKILSWSSRIISLIQNMFKKLICVECSTNEVDYMAPNWRRMYSISLCFFSCASPFPLNCRYDILRVPINLDSRVSILFHEIYQVWKSFNLNGFNLNGLIVIARSRKSVTARGGSCLQLQLPFLS